MTFTAAGWWREADELDDAQQRVVGLPRDGKYLITGKPGSGKTNLLVLRAAYLIRSDYPDIKVLTWTRLINEFIASGVENHGLETDRELQTFKSWAEYALNDIGINIVLSGNFSDQIQQLTNALVAARCHLMRYDGILIDEAQDYTPQLLELFNELTDRLFLSGDDNQRLYDSVGALEAAERLVDEVIILPFHYRNGRKICLVAEAIKGEDDYTATSRYDEKKLPSQVKLERCKDFANQISELKVNLIDQLRSYPNELLGVMVPRNDDLAGVVEALRASDEIEPYCQFQSRAEGNTALEVDKPIIVSTINAAKGVEYRAAHIVAMEGIGTFPPSKHRNLAYTAVTRAKTTLRGYYTESIPSWLLSAFLRGQNTPNPAPTLADLLPRRTG